MEWQPIDTAPKDGTKIIVWDGSQAISAEWDGEGFWIDEGFYIINATHWMPLPPPPKGE